MLSQSEFGDLSSWSVFSDGFRSAPELLLPRMNTSATSSGFIQWASRKGRSFTAGALAAGTGTSVPANALASLRSNSSVKPVATLPT